MTSFAQPIVIQCPKCHSCLHRRRLCSFNDFGAMGWSDGHTSIFGLSLISQLGRCAYCRKVFWLDDLEELGVLPKEGPSVGAISRIYHRITRDSDGVLERERIWNQTPWEWKNAKPAEMPDYFDLKTALADKDSLTPERELLVRRALWFHGNDHLRLNRDGKPLRDTPKMSDLDARENMLSMLDLIAEGHDSRPTEKGELLRELGRFEEAIEALRQVTGDAKAQADLIIGFAKDSDHVVREIWRSQYDF
jgi:hypothetical protein